MKRITLILILSALLFQSCGTVFGGRITEQQRNGPNPGEPRRKIRPAALILDIVLLGYLAPIALGIDFLTGGIYKPGTDYIPAPKKKPGFGEDETEKKSNW